MQVTLEYAEAHLAEILSAAEGGEDVQIARPGMPALRLAVTELTPNGGAQRTRGLYGSGKGKIWLADDWDSEETNAEIAALFYGESAVPDQAA